MAFIVAPYSIPRRQYTNPAIPLLRRLPGNKTGCSPSDSIAEGSPLKMKDKSATVRFSELYLQVVTAYTAVAKIVHSTVGFLQHQPMSEARDIEPERLAVGGLGEVYNDLQ
jgi:hypothetical protein